MKLLDALCACFRFTAIYIISTRCQHKVGLTLMLIVLPDVIRRMVLPFPV